MDKKISLKRFRNNYLTYLDILVEYRSQNFWFMDEEKSKVHTIPFLLTVASTLECLLNDHIIQHYNRHYPEEYARNLISSFLSINLKGKLTCIVPLLTNHKYTINQNNKTFQILSELIKLRNSLVHNKSEYEIHSAYIKHDENGSPTLEPDEKFLAVLDDIENHRTDFTLGVKRKIGEYHDAIEHLYDAFFSVYDESDFTVNELIIELPKNNEDRIQISLA